MDDLVPAFLVTVGGGLLAVAQASRFSKWESMLLLVSFAAHVVSVAVQVKLTMDLYGGGDLFAYSRAGEMIADLLQADFGRFAPEVLRLLFRQGGVLPTQVVGPGSATGAMMALSGFLTYFTGGSTHTLCLTFAIAAYFGKVALYRAFRLVFSQVLHRRLLVAAMLVPSVVFWSSALLKEPAAIVGMGYFVLGMVRLRRGGRASAAIQMALGAVVVALMKAYILFPLILAAGAWFYLDAAEGTTRVVRPAHLLVAGGFAVAGVVLLGYLFPLYSLENLAEQAALRQEIGQRVTGMSTYSIGDPTQTTLAGQLAFAPFALVTSLYRPFLVEANSVQVAVNSLETTTVLFLTVRSLMRRGVSGTWSALALSPMLAFCALFTVTFGVAVGLTTTNLGTLSRYRMPLMPLFCGLLLVLDARVNLRAGAEPRKRGGMLPSTVGKIASGSHPLPTAESRYP